MTIYKITSIDSFRHTIYESYEDAAIDGINWYIIHISMYKIGDVGCAIDIKHFINAVDNNNYNEALEIGKKITSFGICIEAKYPKSILLKPFNAKFLKQIDDNLKKIVFK